MRNSTQLVSVVRKPQAIDILAAMSTTRKAASSAASRSSQPAKRSSRPRRKQHERSAESAQRLLEVTIELIAKQGFEKTSAAEIGERAGYSRAMVRHRYGSKEDLLRSLLDEFRARLSLTPAEHVSGLDRALDLLDLMRREADAQPAALRAFFVLCMEAVGPVPLLGAWMRDWFAAYRKAVKESLLVGQRDGSVRADLDADEHAFKVTTYGAGLGYCWGLDPELVDFSKAIRKWMTELRNEWAAVPAKRSAGGRRSVSPGKGNRRTS